ncbi:MAG TPA: geranylgeranyl reductase family protein [Victivallales bacterium]|nr:geranylgeranyl reductase family protein [Victivallales bacterium]
MYDLIIIGAGPSGSSAARRAGKLGLNTLVIEKEKFPRYKPCGGAISERAKSYLDFKLPDKVFNRNILGTKIYYKDNIIEKYKDHCLASLTTRSVFDNYLLDEALKTGITVKQEEKVINYIEKSERIEVITDKDKYISKYLIIAEGAVGNLKYKVRKRDKKNEYGICVVTEIEDSNKNINKYIKDAIEIHFGIANLGYGWVFPHDNFFSVGIGGIAKDIKHPKKILSEFLSQRNFKGNYKFNGHLIPAGGIKRTLISSKVILVGDAGGFIDTFTGEGIAYAIKSGQIASDIISDILKTNNKNKLNNYYSIINSEFGSNLHYSLILSRIMHAVPGVCFDIFTKNDEIVEEFLNLSLPGSSYKKFIKWMLPRGPLFIVKNLLQKKPH